MMLPPSRGQLIKINKLNIGEQTKQLICGPWFTNDYINKWRRRLNMRFTFIYLIIYFWHQNDLPCGGPRPPPTGYMKLQKKKKKVLTLRKHILRQLWHIDVNLYKKLCAGTLSLGLCWESSLKETRLSFPWGSQAPLRHSQPKQAYSYLFMTSLIMFSGSKWWGEEEEEAKRLKAIFEHLNASN